MQPKKRSVSSRCSLLSQGRKELLGTPLPSRERRVTCTSNYSEVGLDLVPPSSPTYLLRLGLSRRPSALRSVIARRARATVIISSASSCFLSKTVPRSRDLPAFDRLHATVSERQHLSPVDTPHLLSFTVFSFPLCERSAVYFACYARPTLREGLFGVSSLSTAFNPQTYPTAMAGIFRKVYDWLLRTFW